MMLITDYTNRNLLGNKKKNEKRENSFPLLEKVRIPISDYLTIFIAITSPAMQLKFFKIQRAYPEISDKLLVNLHA